MGAYKVIAPLVVAKDESDRDVYIYDGQPVPANITEKSVERLLEEGFIVSTEVEESAPERPAESGPGSAKEKWFAYAEFHGITVADDASKEDIIAAVTEAGK